MLIVRKKRKICSNSIGWDRNAPDTVHMHTTWIQGTVDTGYNHIIRLLPARVARDFVLYINCRSDQSYSLRGATTQKYRWQCGKIHSNI